MGVLLVGAMGAGSISDSGIEPAPETDEFEQPSRSPITAKNLLDRPPLKGVPAGFSIEFARVRSNPQRFDSVLSIVV